VTPDHGAPTVRTSRTQRYNEIHTTPYHRVYPSNGIPSRASFACTYSSQVISLSAHRWYIDNKILCLTNSFTEYPTLSCNDGDDSNNEISRKNGNKHPGHVRHANTNFMLVSSQRTV
jgi:hypothetical protein